jgi:hypothetical protein
MSLRTPVVHESEEEVVIEVVILAGEPVGEPPFGTTSVTAPAA